MLKMFASLAVRAAALMEETVTGAGVNLPTVFTDEVLQTGINSVMTNITPIIAVGVPVLFFMLAIKVGPRLLSRFFA